VVGVRLHSLNSVLGGNYPDIYWMSMQEDHGLTKAHIIAMWPDILRVITEAVDRAVRTFAVNCGDAKIEQWAIGWVSGENRRFVSVPMPRTWMSPEKDIPWANRSRVMMVLTAVGALFNVRFCWERDYWTDAIIGAVSLAEHLGNIYEDRDAELQDQGMITVPLIE
jgi:hypothetical protein